MGNANLGQLSCLKKDKLGVNQQSDVPDDR